MSRLVQQRLDDKRFGTKGGLFEISLDYVHEQTVRERGRDRHRVKAFKKALQGWCIDVTMQLRRSVRLMVRHDEELSASIEPRIYSKYGEPNRIGFTFAREGVYIHKGAGRGQGGFKGGSRWFDRFGVLKKTDSDSFGKMGSGKRKPKLWFDPVIRQNLDALADIVAEYSADMQVDATRIFIDR